MEVRVCKNCRRLFKYIYGPELCQECSNLLSETKSEPKESNKIKPVVKGEESKFLEVRDYIMARPNASISQIAEDNDILPSKLLEWVREERLEFSEASADAWFNCEKCGAKIKSGRLCNRCKIM